MISKNIVVEYLHPEIWKNASQVLEHLHPLKNMIYVYLHENGSKHYYDQHGTLPDLKFEDEKGAEEYIKRYPEIEEIWLLTRSGLANYNKNVQDAALYTRGVDEYISYLFEELKITDGIKVITNQKIKYRCIWDKLKTDFFRKDGILFFWIEKEQILFFNCILQFSKGELVKITTTDRYDKDYNQYNKCQMKIKQEFQGMEYYEIRMELSAWQKATEKWYYT